MLWAIIIVINKWAYYIIIVFEVCYNSSQGVVLLLLLSLILLFVNYLLRSSIWSIHPRSRCAWHQLCLWRWSSTGAIALATYSRKAREMEGMCLWYVCLYVFACVVCRVFELAKQCGELIISLHWHHTRAKRAKRMVWLCECLCYVLIYVLCLYDCIYFVLFVFAEMVKYWHNCILRARETEGIIFFQIDVCMRAYLRARACVLVITFKTTHHLELFLKHHNYLNSFLLYF